MPTDYVYAAFSDIGDVYKDDVWLTDFGSNALARFDLVTETFVSMALPNAASAVRQLHGRPGQVWGASSSVDKMIAVRRD